MVIGLFTIACWKKWSDLMLYLNTCDTDYLSFKTACIYSSWRWWYSVGVAAVSFWNSRTAALNSCSWLLKRTLSWFFVTLWMSVKGYQWSTNRACWLFNGIRSQWSFEQLGWVKHIWISDKMPWDDECGAVARCCCYQERWATYSMSKTMRIYWILYCILGKDNFELNSIIWTAYKNSRTAFISVLLRFSDIRKLDTFPAACVWCQWQNEFKHLLVFILSMMALEQHSVNYDETRADHCEVQCSSVAQVMSVSHK